MSDMTRRGGEILLEVVDEMGNRYPVMMDTLEDFYRGDIETYVQEEIVPQYEWRIEQCPTLAP